jgi:hypothetical protein
MKTIYPESYKDQIIRSNIVGFVPAFVGNKELPKYKVELLILKEDGGKPVVMVFQPIDNDWHHVGTWYLQTLLEKSSNHLVIDGGQNWYVSGMSPVLDLAQKIEEDWG